MPFEPHELLQQHPDIVLVRTRLPRNLMGCWFPDYRVILLDDRLSLAEERCTLMHELLHALSDDEGLDNCWLDSKQERRCHETAARALIPLDRLAAALQWGRGDLELAQELDVDLETLRVRCRTLSPAEVSVLDDRLLEMEESA